MIALDTNVVSELTRERPSEEVLRWLTRQSVETAAITAITVAELLLGLELLPRGRRRQTLEDRVAAALTTLPGRVLAFDAAAAEAYTVVGAARRASGRPINVPDAQIAAICRAHGAALATRNTKAFEGTGVELIDPWLA